MVPEVVAAGNFFVAIGVIATENFSEAIALTPDSKIYSGLVGDHPVVVTLVAMQLCSLFRFFVFRWEERRAANGRVHYVNHVTRTTQWERPTRYIVASAFSIDLLATRQSRVWSHEAVRVSVVTFFCLISDLQ